MKSRFANTLQGHGIYMYFWDYMVIDTEVINKEKYLPYTVHTESGWLGSCVISPQKYFGTRLFTWSAERVNENVSYYRTQLGRCRLTFPPEERNRSSFRKVLFCGFGLVGDGHIPEIYVFISLLELFRIDKHTHSHTQKHTQLPNGPHSEIYSHCGSDQLGYIVTCCTSEKFVMRHSYACYV